ncbi:hypothetical protein ACSSWA_00085 [Melioribacter sp. Ez-97]|uniref:hypothetical protein n=1 Tax=Melioribacter sp. Ez-97 TaxID=3423434 RepID=UPI003ED876ED
MAVKENYKGLRVNYLIIFLSGLVLLFTALLVFLLILKNIYGDYEIREIIPTKENLIKDEKAGKIAILYSRYTENMLPAGSTWLKDNIDTWERFVSNTGYKYDVINDRIIENGEHYGYKIIVLPGSKSLSDRQIIALKKYVENGGSLFVTGGPATFSDEGKWRGWDFFTEVFGLKFNKEIKPEETYKIHTLRGNLPLTAGIPTGYALKIATWDRPIYAEVIEPRTTQVSFWYDFRREAGLVREEIQKSSGIAFGTYGRGRFVWFGFEINSVLGVQKDFVYFEKLFNNSINWLTYNPTAFTKDWPGDYKAALILVPTVDEALGNIKTISSVTGKYNIKPTFFIDPYTALKNKSVVRSLSKNGDIGAIVDIGFLEFPEDTVNKLYDKQTQLSNIAFAQDSIGKIIGKPIKAVMPLYGFYNDFTLQALSNRDIGFLLTDSLTDRSVPEIKIRNNKQIMIITKTARDDYEVIRNYGLTETKFQRYTYEEDVDRLLFEGGLFVFKVHTNYQLQPQYVSVINDVIRYARGKDFWITSLDELKSWWRKKQSLEVRYESRSKRRVAVELTNPSEYDIENAVVEVNLNKKVKNVKISSDMLNTKIPRYEVRKDNQAVIFYIDRMKSHETRSLLIDFENIDENSV